MGKVAEAGAEGRDQEVRTVPAVVVRVADMVQQLVVDGMVDYGFVQVRSGLRYGLAAVKEIEAMRPRDVTMREKKFFEKVTELREQIESAMKA